MDIQINNRLEAFLYWKVTGIKPEGWDLTPRNKEEEYLAATCERIDEIAGGGPTPPTPGSNDYADYINKPIELMPPYEEKDFEDLIAGDVLHIDVTKPVEMELFLKGLTYSDDDGQPIKFLIGASNGEMYSNTLMALIYPKEWTGTENDAYILQFWDNTANQCLIYSTEAFTISNPSGEIVIPQGFNFGEYMPIPVDGSITITSNFEHEMEFAPEMSEQSLIKLLGIPALEEGIYYKQKAGKIGKVVDGNFIPVHVGDVSIDLYQHYIKLKKSSDDYYFCEFIIYNHSADPLTAQNIYDYLKDNGYSVSTDFYSNNKFYGVVGNYRHCGIAVYAYSNNFDIITHAGTTFNNSSWSVDNVRVTDMVQKII